MATAVAVLGVLSGCSLGPPPEQPAQPLSIGVWRFSAVVHGENRYRSRTERISQAVNGELRLLPPDNVRIESSHGSCDLHVVDAVAAEHRFACAGLTLYVRPQANGLTGRVSIALEEVREERVSCDEYQIDRQTGQPTQVCLRWRYSPRQVTTQRAARASFTPVVAGAGVDTVTGTESRSTRTIIDSGR